MQICSHKNVERLLRKEYKNLFGTTVDIKRAAKLQSIAHLYSSRNYRSYDTAQRSISDNHTGF